MLSSEDEDPYEQCYHREKREIMSRALSHLRERDRRIITLYYQQELTMKQIANCLGVDESRVSQLHSAALSRLKSAVDSMLYPRRTAPVKPLACMSMAA